MVATIQSDEHSFQRGGEKPPTSIHLIGFLRGGGDSPNLPYCSLRLPDLPSRNP